jgi:hypothetical protein
MNPNTTEMLRGHPLAERVLARQAELEDALAHLGPDDSVEIATIETALATLASLLTGDVTHPTDVVARDLNTWLQRNRYLGLSTRRIRAR